MKSSQILVVLHRYFTKVHRELELDETALSNLQADRQRFLCKAVENYIQCLEEGEEHDTWVFRLASLWLENADVKPVNDMMAVSETPFDLLPPEGEQGIVFSLVGLFVFV